jgi:hypothetical protein
LLVARGNGRSIVTCAARPLAAAEASVLLATTLSWSVPLPWRATSEYAITAKARRSCARITTQWRLFASYAADLRLRVDGGTISALRPECPTRGAASTPFSS